MKRSRVALILMIGMLALISPLGRHGLAFGASAGSPAHATAVCGRISSNTTWTTAASPFDLTCNVTVDAGVNLTVNAGVEVDAGPNISIQVLGTLTSAGAPGTPVLFQSASNWLGIRFSSAASSASSVSYTEIDDVSDTALTNYPGAVLSGDVFLHDHIALGGSLQGSGNFAPLTHALTVQDAVMKDDANPVAYNIDSGGALTVQHSYFENNTQAFYLAVNDPGSATITSSTITGSQVGVRLIVDGTNIRINDDNILGSSQDNVVIDSGYVTHVDATNDWWGTSDPSAIQRTIQDCNADLKLPCVDFQPFLSQPSGDATTATPTPSPTATATVIPSPTLTPTTVPTVRLTPSTVPTMPPTASTVPTSVPTLTPTPRPQVLIDHVLVLHWTSHQRSQTSVLRLGERAWFYVLYHTLDSGSRQPGAYVAVTNNGRWIAGPKLTRTTFDHHTAFGAQVVFRGDHDLGKAYAHFHLSLGGSAAKEDRQINVVR